MPEKHQYQGSCHCGAIQFSLDTPRITQACRCNCSICRKKNALMSANYFEPEEFKLVQGQQKLSIYQFGDHDVNHYFCSVCGIAPFHDGTATPGHFRVNLRCITGLDLDELAVKEIDGASF